MNLSRPLAVFAALAIAWFAAGALASDDDPAAIALQPGYNVVTWSDAEPYAIANFEDTPVTRIYRWDAVGQRWLSRVVGRDGATLPELHLLPRVQYLLAVDAAHVLTIANPRTEIDPHAELRFAAAPDDPLRFEAYWPNEDSPLEDLILLRPDGERLSVKAEVAGGTDKIDVYWVLDGRLNHQGLASDDVELLPGKHDEAMLYSVDGSGQAVAVELPRVVKLPQVEIPEMVYGVNDFWLGLPPSWNVDVGYYDKREDYSVAIRAIADLGIEYVRFVIPMEMVFRGPNLEPAWDIEHLDWTFLEIRGHGLKPLPVIGNSLAQWVDSGDVTRDRSGGSENEYDRMSDVRHSEALGRAVARRWPSARAFEVGNEPNIKTVGLDPLRQVEHQRALALGIWYERPDAIIVSASLCCSYHVLKEENLARGWPSQEIGVDMHVFLEAMYQAGFGPWHDVVGVHIVHYPPFIELELDEFRRIMALYGEGDKPLWVTEQGAHWQSEEQYTNVLVSHLQVHTQRDDVQGYFIWKLRDSPGDLHPHADNEHHSGIVGREIRDGRLTLQPSGIAVRDLSTIFGRRLGARSSHDAGLHAQAFRR